MGIEFGRHRRRTVAQGVEFERRYQLQSRKEESAYRCSGDIYHSSQRNPRIALHNRFRDSEEDDAQVTEEEHLLRADAYQLRRQCGAPECIPEDSAPVEDHIEQQQQQWNPRKHLEQRHRCYVINDERR
jgi:hypothetical protein